MPKRGGKVLIDVNFAVLLFGKHEKAEISFGRIITAYEKGFDDLMRFFTLLVEADGSFNYFKFFMRPEGRG